MATTTPKSLPTAKVDLARNVRPRPKEQPPSTRPEAKSAVCWGSSRIKPSLQFRNAAEREIPLKNQPDGFRGAPSARGRETDRPRGRRPHCSRHQVIDLQARSDFNEKRGRHLHVSLARETRSVFRTTRVQ